MEIAFMMLNAIVFFLNGKFGSFRLEFKLIFQKPCLLN